MEFFFSALIQIAHKCLWKPLFHSPTFSETVWLQCCWNSSSLSQRFRMKEHIEIELRTWGIFSSGFCNTDMNVLETNKYDWLDCSQLWLRFSECDEWRIFVHFIRKEWWFCYGWYGSKPRVPLFRERTMSTVGGKKGYFI